MNLETLRKLPRSVFGSKLTTQRFIVASTHLCLSYSFLIFWAGARVYEDVQFQMVFADNPEPKIRANWVYFGIYAAVAPLWFAFVLLDSYRQGTFTSRIGFEIAWLSFMCAFNIYLAPLIIIDLQYQRTPTHKQAVFFFEFASLCLATLVGLGWIAVLLAASLEHHLQLGRRDVWHSGIRDFTWYGNEAPAPESVEDPRKRTAITPLRTILIGQSRGLGVRNGFYHPLAHFMWNHTPFRRVIGIEPVWLGLVRGTVAILLLSGVSVYAALQCIVNPIIENDTSLPTRPSAYYAYSGSPPFLPIDLLPIVFTVHPLGDHFNGTQLPIMPVVLVNCANGTIHSCNPDNSTQLPRYYCGTDSTFVSYFNGWSSQSPYGDTVWLDSTQMTITMTLDWTPLFAQSSNLTNFVAMAGLDGEVYEDLWGVPVQPIPMPRRFQHPSWLRLRPGQNIQATVSTYRVLLRRPTFLDILGINLSPNPKYYHPLTSVEILPSSGGDLISAVTFVPTFGLLDHQVLEEYRESTVVAGLSATGGFFSIVDLVFGILFGKALLAVVFGGKPISTFGFVSSIYGTPGLIERMRSRYPDLRSSDPGPKAYSTTEFLHDFVVDFGPGFVKEAARAQEPNPLAHGVDLEAGGAIELMKMEDDRTPPNAEHPASFGYAPLPLHETEVSTGSSGPLQRKGAIVQTP